MNMKNYKENLTRANNLMIIKEASYLQLNWTSFYAELKRTGVLDDDDGTNVIRASVLFTNTLISAGHRSRHSRTPKFIRVSARQFAAMLTAVQEILSRPTMPELQVIPAAVRTIRHA